MLTQTLEDGRKLTDAALERLLPAASVRPTSIHKAMRHSVFAGGKRIRPILCIEAGCAVAGSLPAGIEELGAALEMLHTYSLIHDDLPALDNDDLRRGRPTCHKVYGEAMAILAGDALQTRAFEILAAAPRGGAMVGLLAQAAGTPQGMVAGQVGDLEAGAAASAAAVRWIHERKTAALLRASVLLGGMAAGATPRQMEQLGAYGSAAGLAFQIADDLLDASASSEELGKTAGKDAAQAKATYPAAMGSAAAAVEAQRLVDAAEAALADWVPAADRLRQLPRFTLGRRR